MADSSNLRVSEIFYSLQGESTRVGLPTVFIRLTGCPLRCVWCDTEYAFSGGRHWAISDILMEVARYPSACVCVTGGEPLAQKGCLPLLQALCDAGHSVSLETSGALDISQVDPRVSRIMDLKAPGSGEVTRNLDSNLVCLNRQDEVKIVLADEQDYRWAVERINAHSLAQRCASVLLSPVQGKLVPADLAAWILRDHLPVRMQLQMHRVIWGDRPGV